MQDVHIVREGEEAAANKDAAENSPLLFLDNILEDIRDITMETLNLSDPPNFFPSLESELATKMIPTRVTAAINNAATAIDLMQGNHLDTNEAKEACELYVQALVMIEAETKLKQIGELANMNQSRLNSTEAKAEIAAVFGATSEEAGQVTQPTTARLRPPPKHIGFDITDLSYDISFLPSNDPDTYKPLEIISYIGITKNIQ